MIFKIYFLIIIYFTLFCQNELCLYSFEGNSSNIIEKCPKCSGNVGIISLAEARILPKGTKVKKLIYNSGYTRFYVSMVVTGEQRSGIHRPQWCLPSQGLLIQNSKIVKCTISSEHSFKVTVLEVEPRIKTTGGGYFAYWFTDKEHEVATHWQRLYWMAYNDVVIGERRPWGYVSIWMPGKITSASYEKLLNFIKKLYPALKIENN